MRLNGYVTIRTMNQDGTVWRCIIDALFEPDREGIVLCRTKQENYRQVEKTVAENNRKSVIFESLIIGLYWSASLIIYSAPEYVAARSVFIYSAVFCMIITLCGLFLIKRVPWMLHPVMCCFLLSLFGTSFGLAFVQPDQRIATMIAVSILVPTQFIERPIITIVLEMSAVVFYLVMGKRILAPDVYSWGKTTLIIFSTVGLILGHMTAKTRFERYVYLASAEKLADIQKNYNKELQRRSPPKRNISLPCRNNLLWEWQRW